MIQAKLPRELGYRMPAEWEPHRATWLAWPQSQENWPGPLEKVQQIWVEMAKAISEEERVCLIVGDEQAELEVSKRLTEAGAVMENVSPYRIPTADVWMRDYGPTFVTQKGGRRNLAFNDWIYNAWGRKYECLIQDDSVAKEMARLLQVPVFAPEIVLEGGSIEVNGYGTCLTTEQCLLNPNRNPHLGRKNIERILGDHLNVDHFIWLGQGIVGDDTDGHIDDIARFVNPKTVVCALEQDSADDNYRPLMENYERLQGARDQEGRKLSLVPLPMPGPEIFKGERLPASYANFYIANGVVLVPTYDHPNDDLALGILRELFPTRKILGIPCRALVVGLGAIHCVTQQQPL